MAKLPSLGLVGPMKTQEEGSSAVKTMEKAMAADSSFGMINPCVSNPNG